MYHVKCSMTPTRPCFEKTRTPALVGELFPLNQHTNTHIRASCIPNFTFSSSRDRRWGCWERAATIESCTFPSLVNNLYSEPHYNKWQLVPALQIGIYGLFWLWYLKLRTIYILSPRYYNNSYFPRAPTFFVVVESTIVIQREIARISFPLRSKCTLTRGSESNIEKKQHTDQREGENIKNH